MIWICNDIIDTLEYWCPLVDSIKIQKPFYAFSSLHRIFHIFSMFESQTSPLPKRISIVCYIEREERKKIDKFHWQNTVWSKSYSLNGTFHWGFFVWKVFRCAWCYLIALLSWKCIDLLSNPEIKVLNSNDLQLFCNRCQKKRRWRQKCFWILH